ncbi:MAG: hypothetical protein AAFU85_14185 [Planctomycetota bacterium]
MMKTRDLTDVKPRINPGLHLPGSSYPVASGSTSAHAFGDFNPVVLEGLTRSGRNSLASSFVDVIRSLSQAHQSGFAYGRIRSGAFHNRGGSSVPAATLWIDWKEAAEVDAVHIGDQESMYWMEDRLQTPRDPQPADDWYALGVVLAEACLSSESVGKIWDVSESQAEFLQKLRSNLRSDRSHRRLATVASKLVRAASSGQVEASLIAWAQSRLAAGTSGRNVRKVALAVGGLALAGFAAWSVIEKNAAQERLVAANEQLLAMEVELENAASSRPTPTAITAPIVEAEPRLPEDRLWWSAQVTDRPLEKAIELAAAREGDVTRQWRGGLDAVASIRGQVQWRKQDTIARKLVQQCVNEPWESKHLREATERLTLLTEAHDRWQAWARSRKTMKDIREQHALMRSGLIKDVLGEWISEVLEVRSFSLDVLAVQNKGDWTAHLVGFETDTDSASESWSWESSEGKNAVLSLEVEEYRAGQSIQFWIQQDGTIPLWNTTVIDLTLDNPLLVWNLSKGVREVNAESGYGVTLSTSKRVGPPPKLSEKRREPTTPSGRPREVVDPRDLLPL